MRILHTSDWHIGKRLGSYSRLEEQRKVLQEIEWLVQTEKIDLVLVAGDLFDTFHPPIEAEELFYKTLKGLSCEGQVPVVVIAGNHDSPDKIESAHVLAREFGIQLLGYPHTAPHKVALDTGLKAEVLEPGVLAIDVANGERAVVLYTPYANESRLRQALFSEPTKNVGEQSATGSAKGMESEKSAEAEDPAQTKETALIDLLAQRWQKQSDKWCTKNTVNLLVSHLFLAGSDTETEEQEGEKSIDHPGGVSRIPVSAVPSAVQYAALGHIHKGYAVRKEPPVVYSGSPLAYSLREEKNTNGVVVIDITAGQPATYKRIPLTSGYQLVSQEFDSLPEALRWLENNQECYVDIVLHLQDYLSPEETKALYQSHPRILDIRLAFEVDAHGQHAYGEGSFGSAHANQNIYELFSEFFQKSEGIKPPKGIMNLFKEIVGEDA